MAQQAESQAVKPGRQGAMGAIVIGLGVVILGTLVGLLLRGTSNDRAARSASASASAPQRSAETGTAPGGATGSRTDSTASTGPGASPNRTNDPGAGDGSAVPASAANSGTAGEPSELLKMMERERTVRAETSAAIPSSGSGGGSSGASTAAGAGGPSVSRPDSSSSSSASGTSGGSRASGQARDAASAARLAAASRQAPAPPPTQVVNQTPTPDPHRTVTPPPPTTPPIPDDPESDRRPPTLVALQFDPPEVVDGSPATIIVTMSDDLAGVKTVTGNLRSPSGAAVLPFQAVGEPGGTTFSTKIPIPSKAESGVWFIANIFATDRADNTLITSFTSANVPAGGTLRVSSSESDSTAPEVKSIYLDRPVISDGEKNIVKMEVSDDRSGVASVTGSFQSPSKAALIPFLCRLNPDSNLWEGDVVLPRNADCGEWSIRQVRVADTAGNIGYLTTESPAAQRATFNVQSQERCDSVPPVLDTITINPAVMANDAATEVTVTVTMHDEGSGPLSVTGWVSGPVATNGQSPRIFFSCAQAANDPQSAWTGRFTVPQFAAKGTWKVGLLRLQDKAHNARDYQADDPMLGPATFTVQ